MRQRLGMADALVKSPGPAARRRADDLDRPARRVEGQARPSPQARRRTRSGGEFASRATCSPRSRASVDRIEASFAAGRLVGVGTVEQLASDFRRRHGRHRRHPRASRAPTTLHEPSPRCAVCHPWSGRTPLQSGVTRGGSTCGPPARKAGVAGQAVLVAAVEQGLRLTADPADRSLLEVACAGRVVEKRPTGPRRPVATKPRGSGAVDPAGAASPAP